MEIKKIIITFLIIDLIFSIFLFLFGGFFWFLNSQVAFFSSLGVTLGSFYSYQRMVNSKLENNLLVKERDLLDKIDDKYELYDEGENQIKNEEKKENFLKSSFNNLKLTSSATFSFYRLLAYVMVFVGFFILQKNSLFIILPYIFGLIIIPFVATFSFLIIKTRI